MGYLTLKLENGDIVFDLNNRIKMIEEISQNIKVWLETQYESDYRDPYYGFKLQELMESDYDDLPELIKLYTVESLLLHPLVDSVSEIEVERDLAIQRKWNVSVAVVIKDTEEIIELGSVVNV